MAHEITINENGIAEAAFALTPAWHGLGQVLDHEMTSEEAMAAAHLDWRVVQFATGMGVPVQTFTTHKPLTPAVIPHGLNWELTDSHMWNVRQDTGERLGLVSKDYQVVQNDESFAFLDSLVEQHQIKYEAAFSLSGGKRVVLLAKLPTQDLITEHDAVQRYVLFGNSHDGSTGISFGLTSVRVVCANTYALALQQDGKTIKNFTVRHQGKIEEKLEQAREFLKLANGIFDMTAEQYRKLADAKLSREQWDKFLDIMCPIPDEADPDHTEKRVERLQKTRKELAANFSHDLQTFDGAAGTAWAAFNAVTQHIDHLPRQGATKARKAEARWNVTQYGPGRDQKKRAFETLLKMVG